MFVVVVIIVVVVCSCAEERYDVLELRALGEILLEGIDNGAVLEVIGVEMRWERGNLMMMFRRWG